MGSFSGRFNDLMSNERYSSAKEEGRFQDRSSKIIVDERNISLKSFEIR